MHDEKLSATENINTVSAVKNINAAEKEKVLGPFGLLTELGEVELGAAENINAVRVDYGNYESLQFIFKKKKCDRGAQRNNIYEGNKSAMSEAVGSIGECYPTVDNIIFDGICSIIDGDAEFSIDFDFDEN